MENNPQVFVVFDWDGTLSEEGPRRRFVSYSPKNYHAYHSALVEDLPRPGMLKLLSALVTGGHRVEIWTARSDEYRELSQIWLRHHLDASVLAKVPLVMRVAGDGRSANVIKGEWLDMVYPAVPDIVFDDRHKTTAFWRGRGITCGQVANNI